MRALYPSILLLSILMLSLGACAPTASLNGDAEADRDAILAQSRAFSAAYVADDVPTLVGIYAADGIAAPGGRDFVRGTGALTAFWTRSGDMVVTRHQAVPEELRVDGDLAYDWGYYEGEAGPPGAPVFFRGKYLIVWQRDADGVWRIAHDMWNSLSRE